MASGVLPPPLDQAALEKLLRKPIPTWFPENRGAENFEIYIAWARSQGYPIMGLEDLKKTTNTTQATTNNNASKGKNCDSENYWD